jgi:hypothetical protein
MNAGFAQRHNLPNRHSGAGCYALSLPVPFKPMRFLKSLYCSAVHVRKFILLAGFDSLCHLYPSGRDTIVLISLAARIRFASYLAEAVRIPMASALVMFLGIRESHYSGETPVGRPGALRVRTARVTRYLNERSNKNKEEPRV